MKVDDRLTYLVLGMPDEKQKHYRGVADKKDGMREGEIRNN
jgi:hypothetical protein